MKYIKSRYLNIIRKENGEFILFHSFYGNIIKVGEKLVGLLNYFETPRSVVEYAQYMNEPEDEINKVVKTCMEKKLLWPFEPELSELDQIKQDSSLDTYPERLLRFYVTSKCNMACSYCFEKNGGVSHPINSETVIDGLKAFNQWLTSGSDKDYNLIKVNYFGGEPLLHYELLQETVPRIRKILNQTGKEIKVTVNTNGTLLDDAKIKWIVDNNIHTYISIDGLKKHHDKYRVFKNGNGTFDIVIDKLKKLVNASNAAYIERSLTVLATINPGNVAEVEELIHFLYSIGIKNISLNAAFNCAVSNDITNWTILNEQEVDLFIKEAIKMRGSMYDKDVHIGGMWGYIPNRLKKGGFAFCQAVGYEIGISPDRKLYTCPCTFNNEKQSIGVLQNSSFEFNLLFNKWRERKVVNTGACKECSLSGICRGGCPGVAVLNDQDIYIPQQCGFWKKFVNSYLSNTL
jgi:uncharacterized protein